MKVSLTRLSLPKTLFHSGLVLFTALLCQCRSQKVPTISQINEGLIDCFEPGLLDKGLPVWCEASAVIHLQDKIWVANDKDMPDQRTSVFSLKASEPLTGPEKVTYAEGKRLKQGKKYEDFALAPNGRVFLTTAFDRIKKGGDWNGYNMLLTWPAGQEADARIVGTDSTTADASLGLRHSIAQLIQKPYFKIEGLAATNSELIWGIREEGESYEKFDYKIKFLQASYQVNNGEVVLGPMNVLGEPTLSFLPSDSLPSPLAVSSIEYDAERKGFWVLTSSELAGKLSAYLWYISAADLRKGSAGSLRLVRNRGGQPLKFNHKAEDITPLGKRQLLIIHDDDREKSFTNGQQRQPHQAPYSLVTY